MPEPAGVFTVLLFLSMKESMAGMSSSPLRANKCRGFIGIRLRIFAHNEKRPLCNVGYRQFSSVLVESVFNSSCFSTLLSGADFSS